MWAHELPKRPRDRPRCTAQGYPGCENKIGRASVVVSFLKLETAGRLNTSYSLPSGAKFRVWDLGVEFWSVGFSVGFKGSVFRVQGLGFRV